MKKIIKNLSNKHFLPICFILIISGFFCFNFVNNPIYVRGDSLFHLSRIQGLSNYFSSPVNFNTFNHQGKAVNLFYPTQILLVVGIINIFLHNLYFSFKFFIYLLVTFGMLNMYYVLYKIKRSILVSISASILFIFDNYFVGNIYERLAMGEVQAYVFLPLLLYGAYELFFGNYKKWYILPIGYALLAYSHLLSLMIVTFFVALLFVVSIFTQNFDKKKYQYILLSGITTIGITAVQIIPIIEQTTANNLYTTWEWHNIGETSRNILDLIWFSINNNFFNFMFGITTLVLIIIGMIIFKKLTVFERTLIVFSIILLFLQTNLMPWNLLEHTPITKVQYLTRFNAFITLFSVVSVTPHLFTKKVFSKWNVFLTSFVIIGMMYLQLSSVLNYYHTSLPKGKNRVIHNERELKKATKNYTQMDYTNMVQHLRKDYVYNVTRPTYLNNDIIKTTDVILSSTYTTSFVKNNNLKQIVNLPITLYKAVIVKADGVPVDTFLSKRGTLAFYIHKKGKIFVSVRNNWTFLARILQIISLLTWCFLFLLLFNQNIKWNRVQLDKIKQKFK